jgi:hypothetical protein
MRPLAAVLVLALLASGAPLRAQRLSVGAGVTRMPGRLGDTNSDHGAILRIGVDLKSGRHLSWSVEGSVERLNEQRRQFVEQCIMPGGTIASCSFDGRTRDTGWSLGSTLRVAPWTGALRPYAVVGLGFLRIRERSRMKVVDDQGRVLDNFSSDGTFSDDALQGHLGVGVTARRAGWPVAIMLEGRATRLLYNYSGGLYTDWNPTIVLGVRR